MYYVDAGQKSDNQNVRLRLPVYKNAEKNKNAYDRYSLFVDDLFLPSRKVSRYEVISKPHHLCVKEKREGYDCKEQCNSKELEALFEKLHII
jgi:hypothetical protein